MEETLAGFKNGDKVQWKDGHELRYGWVVAIVRAGRHPKDVVDGMNAAMGSTDFARPRGGHLMPERDHDSLLIEVPQTSIKSSCRPVRWPKLELLKPFDGHIPAYVDRDL